MVLKLFLPSRQDTNQENTILKQTIFLKEFSIKTEWQLNFKIFVELLKA